LNATFVRSIFKKGDQSRCKNYHGIYVTRAGYTTDIQERSNTFAYSARSSAGTTLQERIRLSRPTFQDRYE